MNAAVHGVFALGAVALAVLAWWLLRPAWRPSAMAEDATAAAGATPVHQQVLREQLVALDQALASGDIDAAQHAQDRAELQRRVLDETPAPQRQQPVSPAGAGSTPWLVMAGLPLFAAAVYLLIGNPAAIALSAQADAAAQDTAAEADPSPEAMLAMLNGMEQRLQQAAADTSPNALQGWTMLARSYASLRRFADADRAYERAITLAPDDAQLLADRADVRTVLDGPGAVADTASLSGQLTARALQIDPRNLKALTLAGNAAYARQDFALARTRWQAARALAPAGGAFAAALDGSLEELRTSTAAQRQTAGAADGPGAASTARITGRVTLAPALAARAAPGDTVFVFARAATGPRMPLAIVQRRVADLPFDFVLDDSLAMSPQHKLSDAAQVVVGVRVSRSGQAMAQRGDLRGELRDISVAPTPAPAAPLQLVIDSVEP